jgi:1-deoxy-D-xylulose-5-phosphate reductoisomerase
MTDMKLPIQYALSYPDRWSAPLPPLDLTRCGPLEFERPDVESFPCLRLAYRALEAGNGCTVVLNAANEVAVASFLRGRLAFTSIPRVVEQAMDGHPATAASTLNDVRTLDASARHYAEKLVASAQRCGAPSRS